MLKEKIDVDPCSISSVLFHSHTTFLGGQILLADLSPPPTLQSQLALICNLV